MRIALIADVHGNLVALQAVLADLAGEAIDRLVCLGDVAATGPQPRAVVTRLRELACPVVMGNADAELLAPPPAAPEPADDAGRFAAISRWCAAQLSTSDLAYLRAFQPTLTVALGDGVTLLCCHGSPRSFDDTITATTPEDELTEMLVGAAPPIIASGHTHIQLVRRYRDTILLNPGSVGLPIDRLPPAAPVRNPAWAEYAIVTAAAGRLALDLRRVPYDLAPLLAAARDGDMPHAAWWLADWDVPAVPRERAIAWLPDEGIEPIREDAP
jgi:predicted phosphodiesterase